MMSGAEQAQRRLAALLAADEATASDDDQILGERRPLVSPCFNRGYEQNMSVPTTHMHLPTAHEGGAEVRQVVGSGNWEACRALTTRLVHLDYECIY